MRTEELAETFEAVNEDGETYEVQLFQTYTHLRTTTGAGKAKGSRRYALSTGEHINQVSETEFRILWRDGRDEELITRV